MNEAETRAEHIDPALAAAGWGVVEGSRILREYRITQGRLEGHGRRGKPHIADYVLVYRNHKLAVVEAKAWDEAADRGRRAGQGLRRQAGRPLHLRHQRPGHLRHRHADRQGGRGRAATRRPTNCGTARLPSRTPGATASPPCRSRTRAASHPSRYYQDIAIERVLEAIAADRQRILLTLATGTGKTFIAFQIAWKLFHSRWNLQPGARPRRPRILFLADRNILADQAYNAFSAFPEDAMVRIAPEDIRKKGKVPKNGSLFFTIFQTFMSGPPKDGQPSPYFGEYPPDFFDFIVIDECHRGGANDESNWRGILEYFAPAVQLGLTATPKRKDNVDTYAYFGEPVYIYSLKDGINDGFLTPFKVKQISTTLDEYVYTPDDQLIEGEIEAGKLYDETDFNKIIEIKEREAHRVKVFMEQIDQREKTLVFCATQDHALAVRDLINQMKTSNDPNYCQRVTANDGELGDQHLRDFQDNEKTIPTILTTSQKLSTGVDARNIRNIVLMRPINSMIEFKQIIGRGTRLYDGKDYFTIYDFVKAHHHFSDPEWDGEPPPSLRSRVRSAAARPASATKPVPQPCPVCGKRPCECPKEPCPVCGQRPVRVQQEEEGEGEARRRQGAHHPAHDVHDLLASRRHAHVGAAVHGDAVRQAARVLQGRSGTARPVERCRRRARSCCRDSPRRASAGSSWPRCRRSSTPRRATSSTCWPTSPTPCRR